VLLLYLKDKPEMIATFLVIVCRWVCKWCLFGFLFGSAALFADTETLYDQYTLQASAEAEVANDLMLVHLQVQHEDRDSTTLAEKVNRDMAWALAQLQPFSEVDFDTRNYSTYPKYEQNRIIGWRSAQTLVIQGSDFDALKDALQILQSKLQIQQMQFRPREETRKAVEDELIQEALNNFKHRASIVQDNMGAQSYRVMRLNINTGGRQGRMRMEAKTTSMRSMDSAPAIEGGQSKVTVNINGQIQLQ